MPRPNTNELKKESFSTSTTNKDGVTTTKSKILQVGLESFWHISRNSPRVNGELELRALPYQRKVNSEEFCVVTYSGKIKDPGKNQSAFEDASIIGSGITFNPERKDQIAAEVLARAQKKFIEECSNSSANIALAFLERKQTIDLFKSLSTDAFRKLKNYKQTIDRLKTIKDEKVRKKKLKEFIGGVSVPGMSKTKDSMADLWLKYIYGIMPLVNDVQQLIDHQKPMVFEVVHGRARHHYDTEHISLKSTYWDAEFWRDARVSAHCTGEIHITDPMVKMLAEYGLTNPMNLIWERIPYSFLVDWFVGVGGWLQGLSAYHGIDVRNYSETLTFKSALTQGPFKSKDAGGWQINATASRKLHRVYEHKQRTTPGLPSPLTLGSSVTWQKGLTSISLLNQKFLKLK